MRYVAVTVIGVVLEIRFPQCNTFGNVPGRASFVVTYTDQGKVGKGRLPVWLHSYEVGYRLVGPPLPILEVAVSAGLVSSTPEAIQGTLTHIGAFEQFRLLHHKVYTIAKAYQDKWEWTEVVFVERPAECICCSAVLSL